MDALAASAPKSTMDEAGCGENEGAIKTFSLWVMLMARIYEIFPLSCPHCGGQMKIIAFIEDMEPIQRILDHIGEPAEAPPAHPARSPPIEWDFDQTVVLDVHDQGEHDYEFDQTVSW